MTLPAGTASVSPDYTTRSYDASAFPPIDDDYTFPTYPAYEATMPSVAPSDAPDSLVKPTEEPAMQAPPGYQLNRLKRDR